MSCVIKHHVILPCSGKLFCVDAHSITDVENTRIRKKNIMVLR